MKPSFLFQVDTATSLVRVTISGFFQPADVAAFGVERARAHARLTCRPNQHLTLIDMREMQIQSQESVEAFSAVLHAPEHYSRRIAIVVSQTLARMQIQRAARDRQIQYFADDIGAAERWLLMGDALAA